MEKETANRIKGSPEKKKLAKSHINATLANIS